MPTGAQPSDIMRILKRRKALGQTVEPSDFREALRSYWDVQASRRQRDQALALQGRQTDIMEDRLKMQQEAMENAEDAAKIQGITEIGATAATGALALKGTRIGSAIGLGPSSQRAGASGGGVQAPLTQGGAAGTAGTTASMSPATRLPLPAIGATTPSGPTSMLTPGGLPLSSNIPALSSSTAPTLTAGSVAGPVGGAGVGALAGGALGKATIGGESGQVLGSAAGGAVGGAVMGSQVGSVGGPYGAVIGFVIGGVAGIIGKDK